MLTRASTPVRSRSLEQTATEDLKALEAVPAGSSTLRLMAVAPGTRDSTRGSAWKPRGCSAAPASRRCRCRWWRPPVADSCAHEPLLSPAIGSGRGGLAVVDRPAGGRARPGSAGPRRRRRRRGGSSSVARHLLRHLPQPAAEDRRVGARRHGPRPRAGRRRDLGAGDPEGPDGRDAAGGNAAARRRDTRQPGRVAREHDRSHGARRFPAIPRSIA